MITGDHPVTAVGDRRRARHRERRPVVTGAEIQSMSDDALEEAVEKARCTPA